MKKRILWALLTILLLVGMLSITVLAADEIDGYQMSLVYNDEQCSVTVMDRENSMTQVASGDYLLKNTWGEVCMEVVVDVKDGYRIKSVNLTQGSRTTDLTEDFIIGVYGWKPMIYASGDFTLEIETEKVPTIPTVTDVRIYRNEARTQGVRPGSNLTITDEKNIYVKAAYSDGEEHPTYTARGFMEYSLDGKTWETTTMGGYYPYFPVASCQYEDKFDTSSTAHSGYDFRIRIEPDDKYCTGGIVYSAVYHVNGGADGTAGDLEVEPLETPVVKVTTDSVTGKPKLSWKAVEGATQYMVHSAPYENGMDGRLDFTTDTSMIDVRAAAGTKYYYYVTAFDEYGGQSKESEIVSCVCDLPRPELKISVVASTGKLKLSWNKVEGASKYEVHRSTDGGKTYKLLKTTTGTSLTNTSITAGNKYYYKVKAIHSNSAANSAFSSAKYGTCDLPRPVVKISVVASTGKLKLRWDAIEGASKYAVYRSTDGGKTYKLLKTTTGTSLTNTSITAGNKYYYRVKAIHSNSNANSAYSSVKYGTCDLARPTATVKLNNKGKPVVSWAKVDGAVKYTVYIYDGEGELVKTSSTTGLKLTHGSAAKGKTYSYRVVAVHSNTNANSAKSIAVSIKSK